jgi:hypothetical protein
MRANIRVFVVALLGVSLLLQARTGLAQAPQARPQPPTPAECQALRERLVEHAKLSEGVRRALATQAARYPGLPTARPAAPASDRAAHLEQIARERQQTEDSRLVAMMRFDLARAMELQQKIGALDAEKAELEKRPAEPQPRPSRPVPVPTPAQPEQLTASAERLPCGEIPGTLDAAKKIRRKELGAREDQGAAIPLITLKGQSAEQIARALAGQFSAWPDAAAELGLLDQDGNGQLEGIVDTPVRDLFRLYRQRSDGTLAIDVFRVPGRAMDTDYDEISRRLDEAILRQTGRSLADLLTAHPVGGVRALTQAGEFGAASVQVLAGNFAEAAKIGGGAARTMEFQNLRGEVGRVLEVLVPATSGLQIRRVLVLPRPNNQEQWEELSITLVPASYWRTDVELTVTRQIRAATGAAIGSPAVLGPTRFSLER